MKQLIQTYRTGEMRVAQVPVPTLKEGGVLVRTHYSLISAGTERATVQVARQNLVGKARSRPDLVRKVITTAQRTGLKKTFDIVRSRLDSPNAMGYSLAGEVIAVGGQGPDFLPGTRVACAGVGYASHAEIVSVPNLLCVPVPDQVSLADAAYGTLGAIALHGVRQAEVGLGSIVGVIGLGLVGQLTVRLLRAAGCRVVGIDLAEGPVKLAQEHGASAFVRSDPGLTDKINTITNGHGLDAVLITAATSATDPFDLSLDLLCDRGRLVIVGGVRMEVPKSLHSPLYRKEIDIRMSRSYGPGRYDPQYEEHGHDYPYGYVRWTENRNIVAFLQLIADGQITVSDLTTHTFPLDQAEDAYALITGESKKKEPYIGILLAYDTDQPTSTDVTPSTNGTTPTAKTTVNLGVMGAGNFGKANILPHLQADPRAHLQQIATARGFTAETVANQFGFAGIAPDTDSILNNDAIDGVYILTRHDSHATLVCQALSAGKSVYVEKPLALNEEELQAVINAYQSAHNAKLMVGYNRRFAPTATALKEQIGTEGGPLMLLYRINAGPLPPESWYLDSAQGGRFIGEGGHFIDLCQYLIGYPINWVQATCAPVPGRTPVQQDTIATQIGFSDGSCATIIYASSGDAGLPKERLELFGRGISAVLDDFRSLTVYRLGRNVFGDKGLLGHVQDKGYQAEQKACLSAFTNQSDTPISFNALIETSLTSFAVIDSLRMGQRISINVDQYLDFKPQDEVSES